MRLTAVLILYLLACLSGCSHDTKADRSATIRIATFNTALSRDKEAALHTAFATGQDAKAKLVAEVLQRTRPDIVLLQEIDYDPIGKAYDDFQRNYLSVSQNGAEPITYAYVFAPPVNTGVLADIDLDADGKITRPNDSFGYGLFPGQYGMVVLSRYPIEHDDIQTFRETLWKDMPGSQLPADYYNDTAQRHLRLSSKTHAIVPITINHQKLHLLISHPTPPVFDGPEDRNGRRNYDEIGFWKRYLDNLPDAKPATLFPKVDGSDQVGVYSFDAVNARPFIILGDLNADPNDGESRPGAVQQLLNHPRINASVIPTSQGAVEAAQLQAGTNATHQTDPATDTADWNDTPGKGSGNLRVDYVLPSIKLNIINAGVYWPTRNDPHSYLNQASDHKLVWIDLQQP